METEWWLPELKHPLEVIDAVLYKGACLEGSSAHKSASSTVVAAVPSVWREFIRKSRALLCSEQRSEDWFVSILLSIENGESCKKPAVRPRAIIDGVMIALHKPADLRMVGY